MNIIIIFLSYHGTDIYASKNATEKFTLILLFDFKIMSIMQVQETEHKVFKTLTDDFGGSMKPSEYSIQSICVAVMNEKNKSPKSKLKTFFNDIFNFSSTSGKRKCQINSGQNSIMHYFKFLFSTTIILSIRQ